jgi:hypothetical protein
MANSCELKIVKGSTEELDFTICNCATCQAIDLTGTTVWFTLKKELYCPDSGATFCTCVTPANHTCAVCGQTSITIPSSDSLGFDVGFYYWQVKLVNELSEPYMSFIYNAEVTNTLYCNA